MSIFREFNINMIPGKPPLIVHASQYESDFVYTFHLVSGKSVLAIPNSAIAVIRGTKRDGNGFSKEASLDTENNKVVVMGDPQLTACAGRNVFELAIINDEKTICTANFFLEVERAPLDSDTIQSETVLHDLQAIINSAATSTQAAEEASASAAEAAESARTLTIDPTLTQSGQAADAKVVGDRIDITRSIVPILYSYNNSPQADGYNSAIVFDDWEIGYILNGNNLARNYAMRTAEKRTFASGTEIVVIKYNTAMSWFYVVYDANGQYESTSFNIANNKYTFTPDSTKQYRFVIQYTDTSAVMAINDGIFGYKFYNSNDLYIPEFYYINGKISLKGFSKPIFWKRSTVALDIMFEAGTIMYAYAENGINVKKTYTFTEDVVYTCDASKCLVWDVELNTVSLISASNVVKRYIVLCYYAYGTFFFGALYTYFMEQQKAMATYVYPEYYNVDNYFGGKLATIRNRIKTVGSHGDNLVFVTDTHWANNRKKSPALVRAIVNNTQINKVIHGGDIPSAYQTESDMYEAVRGDNEAWRYAVGDYLYRLIGNHDIHATDRTDPENPVYIELTADEVYGLMMSEQENRVHYNLNELNGGYFYFDNQTQRIRYICVNNFQSPAHAFMSNYQVSWIGDRLLELEAGWSVVFFGHCSIIQGQNAEYARYADLLGLITAAANKTTFTPSYGRTFDFTGKSFTVVGYFAGHQHEDLLNVVGGVTYVVTTCDALYQDDGYGRTINSINEQAFDVISIDTSADHVYMTRIGAGSDRDFAY